MSADVVAKARAVIIGDITVSEPPPGRRSLADAHQGAELHTYHRSMLLVFDTPEDFRKAVTSGVINAGGLCGK